MNSNLAHDVYINQGKAIALANQVTDFLLAQGKVTQIPFGQSGIKKTEDGSYKTSQQTMRSVMTQSISANRPILAKVEKTLTKEQQRHKFNFEAKHKALAAGQDTFMGRCDLHNLTEFRVYVSEKHVCLECRNLTKKRRMEAV